MRNWWCVIELLKVIRCWGISVLLKASLAICFNIAPVWNITNPHHWWNIANWISNCCSYKTIWCLWHQNIDGKMLRSQLVTVIEILVFTFSHYIFKINYWCSSLFSCKYMGSSKQCLYIPLRIITGTYKYNGKPYA